MRRADSSRVPRPGISAGREDGTLTQSPPLICEKNTHSYKIWCIYVCMYVSIYGRIYVTYTPIYLWIYYTLSNWPNNSRCNWSKNVCSMNVSYIHAGISPCVVRIIMNALMHYLSLWMYVIKCIRSRVLTWMPSELTATPMLCWRFLETPT